MHTVLAADSYGVPVLAVPGSVRSPQSEGTNAIIQEGGAGVALDVDDVLAALSLACEEEGLTLEAETHSGGHSQPGAGGPPSATACTPAERSVLDAVDYTATLTDLICLRTRLDLGVVALALDRLEELGLVRNEGAGWVRR